MLNERADFVAALEYLNIHGAINATCISTYCIVIQFGVEATLGFFVGSFSMKKSVSYLVCEISFSCL